MAQIARALARALRCDEDLAEAVALVHDFGHTPFGHTGEDALDDKMRPWGGFDHNAQSLRVVTRLERRYAEFDGLNLSWETLEGLVKHNGPLTGAAGRAGQRSGAEDRSSTIQRAVRSASSTASPAWRRNARRSPTTSPTTPMTSTTACAPACSPSTCWRASPLPAAILAEVRGRYPHLDPVRTGHELMRRQITVMVEDVIATAACRARRSCAGDVADDPQCRPHDRRVLAPRWRAPRRSSRRFSTSNIYRAPSVMTRPGRAPSTVVRDLFDAYFADPREMPEGWREGLDRADDRVKARYVADFLAGMTDTYALKEHRRLFDHTPDFG